MFLSSNHPTKPQGRVNKHDFQMKSTLKFTYL